jgi:hypothetical protein
LRQTYGQDFNYNGAPAMPTADEATRKAVEDALYSRSTARLDPRYQQAGSDLESRLAAQGITQGSEAYNREQGNLGMNRNDAYQAAMNDAVSGSTNAMQQLFNMGMGARQQGVTEANTMRAMPTQEALAAANLNATAGQDLRGYYGTELAQEQAIPNIAGAQAQAEASQRAQALSEQTQIRNQIMNELNALRTGSQVSMPNFSAQGGGATVGAAPVAQSAYNSYQGDVNSYNAAVGSNNSMMSGLMNLGGAAMMAPTGTFSGLAAMF